MPTPLDDLLQLLDLENLEVNLFRGRSPQEGWQRVFGGQVLAQALVAADRTVEAGLTHSFHAYFLRPGAIDAPIIYQVDRTRDGRSFTTRRVVAIQHGRAIFHLEASFHREEKGPEHQLAMPEVPGPEGLPRWEERLRPLAEKMGPNAAWFLRERAIDIRHVSDIDPIRPEKRPPLLDVWIRVDGELPDDPALHQRLVAYASDMTLLDAVGLPHGLDAIASGYQLASLDHAMWFHRPFRADEWLLFRQESPAAAGARGFSTGRLYTRDGQLAVSVVQEGLIRPVQGPAG